MTSKSQRSGLNRRPPGDCADLLAANLPHGNEISPRAAVAQGAGNGDPSPRHDNETATPAPAAIVALLACLDSHAGEPAYHPSTRAAYAQHAATVRGLVAECGRLRETLDSMAARTAATAGGDDA